ncbi:MAG: glycosyltransferase family 2 protein [Bacteroidetes bacterium]|nr:glycosyltransferase family 2 protein [Bacteroidota bacterium]
MKASVVIPSYNGAHKVTNILAALNDQTLNDFEVILVIDGSTDGTSELIDPKKYNYSLKIIDQANSGRAATRNNGVTKAESELIIFLDDDMVPENECLKVHYNHHQSHEGTIMVGAQIMDGSTLTSDIQRYKLSLDQKWSNALKNSNGPMSNDNLHLTGANFSISKKSFEQVGGFDSKLKIVEDIDFAFRAAKLSMAIYYNYDAFAFHNDHITCRIYVKKQREYFNDMKNLMELKPEIKKSFLAAQQDLNMGAGKKVIYNLLSRKMFVNIVDNANFFRFLLPRNLRYKVYDVIIWGLTKYFPKRAI